MEIKYFFNPLWFLFPAGQYVVLQIVAWVLIFSVRFCPASVFYFTVFSLIISTFFNMAGIVPPRKSKFLKGKPLLKFQGVNLKKC